MSRRQYTTLTLSVQINVPAGESVAAFIARFTERVVEMFGSCIVRLTDKKVTYL